LSLDWGWELHDDHFKKSFSGVNPLLEDTLHEMLSLELFLIRFQGNVESDKHLFDLLHLTLHGGFTESNDWLHHESDESSLKEGTTLLIWLVVVLPLLGLLIKVVITPKLLHHLFLLNTELEGIDLSELSDGESPSEKSGTESSGTHDWVNLLSLTHIIALIGGDDNVNVLYNSQEVLVHGLTVNLKFEDTSVNLVDHEDWLDLLGKSLSQDSLGLDRNTLDVIDDDKCTISDSESSGDF
jgi:hypothetical protein